MLTLYKFELRKIVRRKIVWITGGILLVGLLIWGIASAVLPQNREYSDSSLIGYEVNQAEREASEQISGRTIDQALIDEMRPAYKDFIYNGDYKAALPYLDVYNLIGNVLGTTASAEILGCDSTVFYERLYSILEANSSSDLTKEAVINDPIVYQGYFDGWRQITGMMKLIACMEIMFVTICLSTVFTVEHTRKTDQVILCTRHGKKKLYTAKILAGLTVGMGFTILLSALMFGIISFLYGLQGYHTILQFVLLRPFDLSIGQAVLILVALSFVGTALVSLFTMTLSEVTKSSIATMGIITGILIITMFIMEMPANLKLLSEIWYMLPSNLVSLSGAFRYSMFRVGGNPLIAYQYAPCIYLILALAFIVIGKVVYNRYQVNGR